MNDANKQRIALAVTGAAIGLGVLLVLTEFFNGRPDTFETTKQTILGLPYGYRAGAERIFMVLFGLIHLAVAGIITVFRRTAV